MRLKKKLFELDYEVEMRSWMQEPEDSDDEDDGPSTARMTTARSWTARDDAPSSARARPRGGSATEAECGPRGGLVVILARVFGFIWDVCGVFMWCICICSNASICQIRISCS